MKVKNNYQECLTKLACSIRRYFELDYQHNTLDYIDKVLDEYQPKNVVTILCYLYFFLANTTYNN